MVEATAAATVPPMIAAVSEQEINPLIVTPKKVPNSPSLFKKRQPLPPKVCKK